MDQIQTNDNIKQWAKKTASDLNSLENILQIKHSPGSNWQSLSYGNKSQTGIINRVSFKMQRHAIFVHKGVGRGTPISMVGQTKRKAKPWFNPVIDKNIDSLADIVADSAADLIVNNVQIK